MILYVTHLDIFPFTLEIFCHTPNTSLQQKCPTFQCGLLKKVSLLFLETYGYCMVFNFMMWLLPYIEFILKFVSDMGNHMQPFIAQSQHTMLP